MGRSAFLEGTGATSPTAEAGAVAVAQSLSRHKPQKGARQCWTALQGSGTLLELVNVCPDRARIGGGSRGIVGNTPTPGVARRFRTAMVGIPWDTYDRHNLYCGNVTYHSIPTDGLRCRQQRKALFRALDRVLGPRGKGCWSGIWCKEFQKRGSVHYHFIIYVAGGVQIGGDRRSLYEIVRDAWLKITGEEDDVWAWLHAVECSQVQDVRRVKWYEVKYMGKEGRHNAKAYEKRQPAWFRNGGRWWGIVGTGLARAYEALRLTFKEFIDIKRLGRSYVQHITHGKVKLKSWCGTYGMTILARGADMAVYRDFVRWVASQRAGGITSALACESA